MNRPLVSVLVFTYNNQDRVYPTLDAIFTQDYPAIEVIVSDDGSADFNEAELTSYLETHKGVNVVRTHVHHLPENRGTVRNVNEGIALAEGKYIFTLAPDDFPSDDQVLGAYVDFMEEHPVPVVFGKVRGVTPEGEYKYELLSSDQDYDKLRSWDAGTMLRNLFKRNFLPAPTTFFRRDTFARFGLYDEDMRLIEDYPYWIRLSLAGETFGFMDRITVDYGLSGVSSAGSYGKVFMEDMMKIYEKYIFPNDRRFGVFQGAYNSLKRGGLNFYMTKANWENLTSAQQLAARVRYAPFFAYTALLDKNVERKNKAHDAEQ